MTWANRITLFRVFLAPVFLVLFMATQAWPSVGLLVVMVGVFAISELSDVLDGFIARKFEQTSDLGKLLDPFSDVVARLTVFLCLLLVGIAPLWVFAVVLYRELSMTFLRLLLLKGGKVQAASVWGKLKAWMYFLASVSGLGQYVAKSLGLGSGALETWNWISQVCFALAALLSVASFIPYWRTYRRLPS
jgi:CDP-diacylglycerol--glycerol-3-phosphate 3-phosphatidyltransferase